MKKTYILHFFIAVISSFFISSCLVEPKFPVEPKISIKELYHDSTGTQDSLVVVVNYQDGDGDIGLTSTEVNDSLNYYQDLYILNEGGEFVKYEFPENFPTFDGRLPVINADGRPKPLEGTIKWARPISAGFKPIISGKTIKFQVKIVDRAGHVSNGGEWAESDSLVVPEL